MKAFLGLLNKERMHYFNVALMLMGYMLLLVWVLPWVIPTYNSTFGSEELRDGAVLTAISTIGFASVILFFASIKRDLKVKELWLHNAQPFWKLVLAKYVYQFLQLFVISAIATIGFFFSGEWIDGSFSEVLTLNVVIMFVVFVFYIFVTGIAFVFFVLNAQLKKYVGKIAFLGTFIAISLFINVMNYIPDINIPYGKISTNWLQSNLPPNLVNIDISIGNIYIVEDLIYYLFFALLFLICCKWLERIVTR